MIVGVSSQVITERQPTVAPSNQLTEARQFLTAKSRHNEFTFSSEVSTGLGLGWGGLIRVRVGR